MNVNVKQILVLALTVALTGCGYSNKVVLPNNARSIAVPILRNDIAPGDMKTYVGNLEIKVTQKLIDEFIFDGDFKVLSEKKADLVLDGSIIAYEQEPYAFNEFERVEEYRLFIAVKLILRDRRTGGIVWEEGNFTGDVNYFISGARAISDDQAADLAIADLAEKIINRLVEDW